MCTCSEREKHMAKLTEKKYSYTVGEWNVNTVAMGGLGKDPDLTAEVEQTGQCKWCTSVCQIHVLVCYLVDLPDLIKEVVNTLVWDNDPYLLWYRRMKVHPTKPAWRVFGRNLVFQNT